MTALCSVGRGGREWVSSAPRTSAGRVSPHVESLSIDLRDCNLFTVSTLQSQGRVWSPPEKCAHAQIVEDLQDWFPFSRWN